MSAISSDLLLLERFSRQGDEQAFAEIVRRYAGLVFSTGYRILADRARAEEVAQETFLRLARRPYSVTHSLGGWLHRAATQVAIDVHRSEKARRHRESAFADESTRHRMEAAADEEPREATSWAEVSPLVDAALSELPDDSRQLLVEHFLEGKTQQQIAAERGISAATICRQMKAAVELLRAKLMGKGLFAAAGALMLWLAENSAQAAPATLLRELGKMSMISPAVRLPPPPPTGWAKYKQAASVAANVLLLLVLTTVVMTPIVKYVRWRAHPAPPPAPIEIDDRAPTSAPAGTSGTDPIAAPEARAHWLLSRAPRDTGS
jgi:RNA polymerase sigma factor (sigma-70 family)